MISYELAKELKDAGFPFAEIYSDIEADDAHRDWYKIDDSYYGEPTLSELIEACGEEFTGLIKTKHSDWLAIEAEPRPAHASGSTPSEAVARLYIALQNTK
jgi:hypothetical protein